MNLEILLKTAENKLFLTFYLDFNVENKNLYYLAKNCNNQTNLNHISLIWFLFKTSTEPNHILFIFG